MPEYHREPEMVLHGLALDEFIRVVMLESEGVP
jgi:hypothetical protein